MGARWNDDEEGMLRVGRIPAGRTAVAARQRCLKLGWPLKGELLGVDMTPRSLKKVYDAGTLRLIRDGIVPDGMSVQGCRYVARTRLGIEVRCRDSDRERWWRERALKVMVMALINDDIIAEDAAKITDHDVLIVGRYYQ